MAEPGEPLSDRELEVLRCMARGAGNKEIAAELFISENTVKVHLRNIFTKLGASSRTEATTMALQQGVIVMPGVEMPPLSGNLQLPVETAVPASNATPEPILATDTTTPMVDIQPTAPAAPRRLNWRIAAVFAGGLLLLLILAAVVVMPQLNANQTATPAPFAPVELGENWNGLRPLPAARADMATAAVGLNLYVIGGETTSGITNTVLVYHTREHLWEDAAAKPTAVSQATAAELFGEIFVPGGRLADGTPTNVVEAYSPTNNAWRVIQSLPRPIAGGLALSDGSSLYLFGGWDGERYLDTAYVYDPAGDSWRPLPPMSQPRAYLAGAAVKGQLFAVGGYDGEKELAVCELFEPTAESWTACPDMLSPRAGAGATSIVNQLYVLGGEQAGENVTFSEQFNPDDATWSIVNTPVLADGSWRDLGVASIETRIFALGGQQNNELIAESYLYAPLVYQTFIPAASSGE
jgi:DNA-binding CsgD family transcriptional regulator